VSEILHPGIDFFVQNMTKYAPVAAERTSLMVHGWKPGACTTLKFEDGLNSEDGQGDKIR